MHNFYNILSKKITYAFLKKGMISNQNKEIYQYGFEILLSTLIYSLVFFSTSILTQTIVPSLVFLIGFFIIRTISGGYHANTYIKCHILSIVNHLTFIIVFKYLFGLLPPQLFVVILIISSIVVFLCAPIEHPNKPFIKNERRRFKCLSRLYSTVVIIISIIFLVFPEQLLKEYFFSYTFGTFSAVVSIVVAKINYKKGLS